MSGSSVLFSGAMLKSPNYVASVEAGELVPQITLNYFSTEEEEWKWWEKMQIMYKIMTGAEYPNSNVALWRIGPQEDGIYLALTDAKGATRFNISDLSTLEQLQPPSYPFTMTGCAHWLREVDTDNSIYFNLRKGLTGPPWVEVLSYSITKNYAIFLFYPVTLDPEKFPTSNFHVQHLFESNRTDVTEVFVVNLNNGDVKGPLLTPWVFSAHHVNAYEESDSVIVLDLVRAAFYDNKLFFEKYKLENLLNPPATDKEVAQEDTTLTRYIINTQTEDVRTETFPKYIDSKYITKFDFPTINEEYRGRKYCNIYGLSLFSTSRTALVKKNVCDSKKDKVLYKENHYMSEMHFLPRPGATEEDDGVLFTVGFDGPREQSYLLVLDAMTFTPINKAYLPHNVPNSPHGMFFPEAKLSQGTTGGAQRKNSKTLGEL